MRRIAPLLLLSVFLLTCDDSGVFTAPLGEVPVAKQHSIVDGAHNDGNDFFFFLPPLVPDPNPTGDFNAEFSAWVEICLLDGDVCDPFADPVATFTNTSGPGSETVRVVPEDELYLVNWHTGDFNLQSEATYRITVFVGDIVFGYADVDVVDRAQELRDVDENEFVGVVLGRTLPIKFRIEHGVLCEEGPEGCTEQKVGQEGGTVPIILQEPGMEEEVVAGVTFPEEALPEEVEEVNVVAEIIPEEEIDDLNPEVLFPKFPFAVNLRTEPEVILEEPLVFTLCQPHEIDDPASDIYLPDEFHDELRVLRDHDGIVQIMPPAPAGTPPVVDCHSHAVPAPAQAEASVWSKLGRFAKSLAKLGGPEPLRASMYLHGGLTCILPMFSNLYTVLPSDGLVSHWPAEGNFNDVRSGYDMDTVGAVAFAPGVEGQAFDFDGSGGVANTFATPGIDNLQELTVSAWVRFNNLNRAEKIQRFVTLLGEKAVIRQEGDGVNPTRALHFYMSIDGSLQHITVPDVFDAGCFHQVTGTYDGSNMRAYLDGEEVGSLPVVGTVDDGWGVELSAQISQTLPGGAENPAGEALDGRLDEVMIYDRALTAEEINAMYAAGGPEKCAEAGAEFSTISISPDVIQVGDSALITLEARDRFGNPMLVGGASVSFSPTYGSLTGYVDVRPTTDNGDGTYQAWLVGAASGLPITIGAHVNGVEVPTGDVTLTVNPAPLTSELAQDLIGGTFLLWWRANHHYAAVGSQLSVAADEHTSSWGNWGMREVGSEPRVAYNNDPTWVYAYVSNNTWIHSYEALSRVKDALIAIDGGLEIGPGGVDTDRAVAFAKFVQGISLGTLALVYDQAFILDEDTWPGPVSMYTYGEVMDEALVRLDDAIAIAESTSFTTPTEWINGVSLDASELAALAHSYKARFMAQVARTPPERAAVDWAGVLSEASQGITADFAPEGDAEEWFDGLKSYAGTRPTWARLDVRYLGPADQSGAFQTWMADSLHLRNAIEIDTDDRRITNGTFDSDGLYVRYFPSSPFRPERGNYHQSFYGDNRWVYHADTWLGPMPEMTVTELDYLRAEAMYRLGNLPGALAIINYTRVTNGQLMAIPTLAGDQGARCVPRDAAGNCQDMWAALKYEKRIEVYHTGMGIAFFDDRGWGDLVPQTFYHLPVPGIELEFLGLPIYTFGGSGPPMVAGQVAGPAGATISAEALAAYLQELPARIAALDEQDRLGRDQIVRH